MIPNCILSRKDSRREVETSRGEDFATKHGMSYMETSAIGATKNVREAFLELLQSADLSSAAGGSAAGENDRHPSQNYRVRLPYK